MNKKFIVVSIIILVVVASGAFYGGTLYGKSHPVIRPGNALANGARFGAGRIGTPGSSQISGDIIGSDSASITVQLPNSNTSKIIFYSGSTQISKTVSGTSADLTKGATVNITGTANSDGTLTAQTIQIKLSK